MVGQRLDGGQLRRWRSTDLRSWKKVVPDRYVPHEQVLDELVAFGRIDGIRRRIDDERSRQLVSPRRTQPWARSYAQRAERSFADGRMQPAGAATVERARTTSRGRRVRSNG